MKRTDGTLTKHHLTPESRYGTSDSKNLIIIPWGMHKAYHHIFNQSTLSESIFQLEDMMNINLKTYKLRKFFRTLFSDRTIYGAIRFLESWNGGRKLITHSHQIIKVEDPIEYLTAIKNLSMHGGKTSIKRKTKRRKDKMMLKKIQY